MSHAAGWFFLFFLMCHTAGTLPVSHSMDCIVHIPVAIQYQNYVICFSRVFYSPSAAGLMDFTVFLCSLCCPFVQARALWCEWPYWWMCLFYKVLFCLRGVGEGRMGAVLSLQRALTHRAVNQWTRLFSQRSHCWVEFSHCKVLSLNMPV